MIGAIALVAILVVFVPMLLDSDPRPPRNEPALTIPPKASAPPLPAPPKAEPAPAPVAEPPKVASVQPTPTPPPAKPAAKAPAKAAAPRLEGFAVQVGAFREDARLEEARQKLTEAKVPHYVERLEAKAGPLTRLRAGPFPTREAAEAALATLKLSALDGKVVTLP